MPRAPRSHLPGAVFHLTARTQGHEPWFTEELRPRIADVIAWSLGVSDALLLAWAIMPNHLHLVVRQGGWRLERVMHPLLHRTAILVQRTHGVEGHVFERRFRDRACLDPDYVRNAIVYTHLNPVRAGLVRTPIDYAWTSHTMYAVAAGGPSCMDGVLSAESGLPLFAAWPGMAPGELRQAYERFVDWRMQQDRRLKAEDSGDEMIPLPNAPIVRDGDRCWSRAFAPLFRPHRMSGEDGLQRRHDLGKIAVDALAELAPGVPLERVRSSCKERAVVRARRGLVRRMSDAGHLGVAIARYLRVTPQCVSNILSRDRVPGRRSA